MSTPFYIYIGNIMIYTTLLLFAVLLKNNMCTEPLSVSKFTNNNNNNRKLVLLKVIRKFFLKHNKSFRSHRGDYEKHNFFPFEGL